MSLLCCDGLLYIEYLYVCVCAGVEECGQNAESIGKLLIMMYRYYFALIIMLWLTVLSQRRCLTEEKQSPPAQFNNTPITPPIRPLINSLNCIAFLIM